jgi:hypothetical protein
MAAEAVYLYAARALVLVAQGLPIGYEVIQELVGHTNWTLAEDASWILSGRTHEGCYPIAATTKALEGAVVHVATFTRDRITVHEPGLETFYLRGDYPLSQDVATQVHVALLTAAFPYNHDMQRRDGTPQEVGAWLCPCGAGIVWLRHEGRLVVDEGATRPCPLTEEEHEQAVFARVWPEKLGKA